MENQESKNAAFAGFKKPSGDGISTPRTVYHRGKVNIMYSAASVSDRTKGTAGRGEEWEPEIWQAYGEISVSRVVSVCRSSRRHF